MRKVLRAIAVLVVLAASLQTSRAAGAVEIKVLSNRADLISGGDALVEVVLPEGADPASLAVNVGGRDVTGAFAAAANGRVLGLVTGLADGPNVLTASVGGGPGARISITNHPIGGAVIGGAQVQPWICTTQDNGLGQPVDAQCNAPTVYRYVYKSTNPALEGFRPYDPANPPSDVATTTTDRGVTVPFIVRVERGTLDRSIYDVAVLFDPTRPTAAGPQPGWNHKLHVPFGVGCAPLHRQDPPVDVLLEMPLGRGFAVAATGLNTLEDNCNTVVSADALMMLKEHVVEAYGEIRYTMSEGCSGGSIQQQNIAASYPGLLDGIIPVCSFPDIWTTFNEVLDCKLLLHYFNEVSPHLWAVPAQRAAVTGYPGGASCHAWINVFELDQVGNPSRGGAILTDCAVPEDQRYHPQTNPTGVRCGLSDYQMAIWGPRPQDGFAKRPIDGVGIQYGVTALRSGLIAPEQFVDLNEKIGGLDIDTNFQARRTEADPGAVLTAHRSGQVTHGRELARVPIIDLRGTTLNLEIHTDYQSYVVRERLKRANGHADNQIIWTTTPFVEGPIATQQAFPLMDRWLSAIEADASGDPLEVKVVRNKPAGAVDACWFGGRQITDMNACRILFPYFGNPRIASGGPLSNDVMKCQLEPLDRSDYNVSFTDVQWSRLQATFATGVCDWTKPGVDQVAPEPWTTYATGPGGTPLGGPPVSEPL